MNRLVNEWSFAGLSRPTESGSSTAGLTRNSSPDGEAQGGFTCPDAVVDLRPGGTYRLVMQPPGDGPVMSVTGTSREVEPPELLVYTWRWDTGPAASDHESLVTVEFTELGDGRTEVTVTHDRFPPGHDASPYRSGWEEGMEKLGALVERRDSNA